MKSLFKKTWLFILIITLLGGVFRFLMLGDAPFRADTMEFYRYALEGRSPVSLWWNPPFKNQMTFSECLMLIPMQVFHWAPTPFNVRSIFALMGTLTIPAVFLLVGSMTSRKTALWAAFLCALSPWHIQVSREAYHYSGVILFATLSFWATWRQVLLIRTGGDRLRDWLLWSFISVIMVHAHMSNWTIWGAEWLFCFYWMVKVPVSENQNRTRRIGLMILAPVLMMILLFPWIHNVFKYYIFGSETVSGSEGAPMTEFLYHLFQAPFVYTFGYWIYGILIFSAIVLGLAFIWWRGKRQINRSAALFIAMSCFCNIITILILGKGFVKFSYLSPLFPWILMLVATAFVVIAENLVRLVSKKRACNPILITWALLLFCASYFVVPIYAAITVAGKPAPYIKLQREIDSHLAEQTVVIVDRWFEPWNELTLYPLHNRYYSFTVPDEPYTMFLQMNWRGRTLDYFKNHPQSAFLELTQNYADKIGRWDWPARFFKQQLRVVNETGLLLRKWGVANRIDFLSQNTNRLISTVYYNKKEDVIGIYREEQRPFVVWFESGWGFNKPWRQTQQFDDYRTLQSDPAVLDIINVTDHLQRLNLHIIAAAVNAANGIHLEVNGKSYLFPNQIFSEQTVDLGDVTPGSHQFICEIRNPSGNSVLFVKSIEAVSL
ncbi:MAG: hypothetical protein EOL87_12020 [Spartobacteria bacterium]|nr:hypothetical protein [Spartobacteria bacterium]